MIHGWFKNNDLILKYLREAFRKYKKLEKLTLLINLWKTRKKIMASCHNAVLTENV